MNGGQAALTGFSLQVVWAILDGLVRDDWTALTIEPTSEDGTLSKVDVRWELLGVERHDQVKSTSATFGMPQVREWASSLEASSTAAELRLVLLGIPANGVPVGQNLGRVAVHVRMRDDETLASAVAYRVERLCREAGVRPPYGYAEVLVERFVGLLLTRSRFGHRWQRATLFNELLAMAGSVSAEVRSDAVVGPGERADRVQAAMRAHGMGRAQEWTRRGEDASVFRTCEWPPPPYADPDGYHEVVVASMEEGPGDCEATGVNFADRIFANCPAVELSYSFGAQGYYEHLPPFRAEKGTVVTVAGQLYDGAHGNIGFYPDRDEIVVLHNAKCQLDRVRCLAR